MTAMKKNFGAALAISAAAIVYCCVIVPSRVDQRMNEIDRLTFQAVENSPVMRRARAALERQNENHPHLAREQQVEMDRAMQAVESGDYEAASQIIKDLSRRRAETVWSDWEHQIR